MSANDEIVKLDVGGVIFKTSKPTLTKFDGFFKTMFESEDKVSALYRTPKKLFEKFEFSVERRRKWVRIHR